MAEPLTPAKAIGLARAWCAEIRDPFENFRVEPNGDFHALLGPAEMRYSAVELKLSVMGLVDLDATFFQQRSDYLDRFQRAGRRELSTMGEGVFYINNLPYKGGTPRLTLKKDFTDGSIPARQFVKEVDWLMEWATYWRKNRYFEIMSKSEDQLISEAQIIERETKAQRPRPW